MKTTTTVLGVLAFTCSVLFGQLNISFTPSGSSRVSDYFSNAYAEVTLSPQGMYDIATDTPYGPSNPFTAGTWLNLGSLTLDGTPTFTGVENFNITGTSGLEFQSVIDGSAFSVLGDYSTVISGVSGTVTLTGGVVTDLVFDSTVSFTFDAAPGLPYVGTLSITESAFALLVDDDTVDFGFGPVRQVWDVNGSAAVVAVPEPGAFALVALGLSAVWWVRRKRPAQVV